VSDRPHNLPASVHQRLLNIARREGVEFEYLLVRYANERLLYRLSQSSVRDQFVLKGAMVFLLWGPEVARQSRDVDLLAPEHVVGDPIGDVFRMLSALEVEDDGLRFDADSVREEEIREQTEYGGVRIKMTARLGNAQVPLQIDVAFGDAVSPAPSEADLPTLLDFPAPRLRTYPRETVIAEKFEAMVRLGVTNTRLKDFYDIWSLATTFEFDGQVLAEAIDGTFQRRRTELPTEPPPALQRAFGEQAESQWRAFCRRIDVDVPLPFVELTEVLADFLMPICLGLGGGNLPRRWRPASGWN
jgi:predicted nucleotidyltransferase component of viral defense system